MKKTGKIVLFTKGYLPIRIPLFFFILLFSIQGSSRAQTILNGSFESNTAGADLINLSNASFNSIVQNSVAFGSYGDMDLITSSTYCGGPTSGNWYVALTGSGTDAFSMKLSAPLTAGAVYSLTFSDHACGSPYSIGPCPVQIGVSATPNSFGTAVYTAPTPVLGAWTARSTQFTAPLSAQYITVQLFGGALQNWTQVDNFVLSAAPLPVELISFTANVNSQNVELRWTTASEINNDHFEVERSLNGEEFEWIGALSGNGTTTLKHDYFFTDDSAPESLLYYRLKQVDFDGAFLHSKIASVSNTHPRKLSVFCSNESEGLLRIFITGIQENESLSLSLVSMKGQEIYKSRLSAENGPEYSISNLETGIYCLRIGNERQVVEKKVAVLR